MADPAVTLNRCDERKIYKMHKLYETFINTKAFFSRMDCMFCIYNKFMSY